MRFLDAIDNPNTKKELSDKFYNEVNNEPFKEALFKTNHIKEVYKHISDIIDTNPSIVIIIDEITNKVKTGLNGLSKYHDIKTIEFKTFKRKNSNCLEEHIHLFNKLHTYNEEPPTNNGNADKNNNNNTEGNNKSNYTEEHHLNGKPNNIVELYNELKKQILNIGDDITIKPLKHYIACKISNTNFVYIVVNKSKLNLSLLIPKGNLNDDKKITADVSNTGHWGNGDYGISLNKNMNLEYIMSLIKQSYEYNKNKKLKK
ncbi:DUF5655 domain-containing protein [Methanococcus aeolicus]